MRGCHLAQILARESDVNIDHAPKLVMVDLAGRVMRRDPGDGIEPRRIDRPADRSGMI